MFKLGFPSEATGAEIRDGAMGVLGMPFNLLVGEGVLFKEAQQGREANPGSLVGEESPALVGRKKVDEGSPRGVVDNPVRFTRSQVEERRR